MCDNLKVILGVIMLSISGMAIWFLAMKLLLHFGGIRQ